VASRERHNAGRLAAEARALAAAGPVVLGTLSSRVEPDAERLAIESAVETGVPLLVVNAVPMPACPRALALAGPEALSFPLEEDYEEVRATAERAAAWGIRVEHLRVTSPRPAKALVELANERGAGLLVLGPKRRRMPVARWRFRRAAREVRRHAACLVWIAGT
jgi:nucleotide-binding universal stress UspA family protein